MAPKPPAARILDQLGITYELVEFDAAVRSASAIADLRGVDGKTVFKTLVVQEEPPGRKPYLVMIPSTKEADLRALARALGVKKVRMASHSEAERLTALQVGGISAIALRGKRWPVYIDEDARLLTEVLVSGGQRGTDVQLAVADLLRATGARLIAIEPAGST